MERVLVSSAARAVRLWNAVANRHLATVAVLLLQKKNDTLESTITVYTYRIGYRRQLGRV